MAKRVTGKYLLFAKEYLVDLNGSRAYQKVWKCSPNAAKVNAHKILTNDNFSHVREYVDELIRNRAMHLDINAYTALSELKKLAYSNTTDFMEITPEGRMRIKDLEGVDTTAIRSIKEIFHGKTGKFLGLEITLHDKTKNLDMLLRHLGQYEKDNDQLQQLTVVEAKEPEF